MWELIFVFCLGLFCAALVLYQELVMDKKFQEARDELHRLMGEPMKPVRDVQPFMWCAIWGNTPQRHALPTEAECRQFLEDLCLDDDIYRTVVPLYRQMP